MGAQKEYVFLFHCFLEGLRWKIMQIKFWDFAKNICQLFLEIHFCLAKITKKNFHWIFHILFFLNWKLFEKRRKEKESHFPDFPFFSQIVSDLKFSLGLKCVSIRLQLNLINLQRLFHGQIVNFNNFSDVYFFLFLA